MWVPEIKNGDGGCHAVTIGLFSTALVFLGLTATTYTKAEERKFPCILIWPSGMYHARSVIAWLTPYWRDRLGSRFGAF